MGIRNTILFLFTLVFALVLFATNPEENQFREYLKSDIREEANKEGGVIGFFTDLFAGPAASFVSVQRSDYYLFSVYKVSDSDNPEKYIGVANHFFKLRG